ncbi:MAG: exodeoxyribonuclease VII small subunit [Lachnospiraceae bacterium]|nr:exodeoxyribonuclease VII small subunit [Lachnospiraceae bacterium]
MPESTVDIDGKDKLNGTDVSQKNQEEKDTSLEELFEELDQILVSMDDREISLEDAFSLYEKGMKKVRQCNEKLDLVEKKMLVISRTGEEELFEP